MNDHEPCIVMHRIVPGFEHIPSLFCPCNPVAVPVHREDRILALMKDEVPS